MPSTLLKGSGRPAFVARAAACAAVANVLLSVTLVNVLGIVGVALGTVIPAGTIATCVIFPAACREVELSVFDGYRRVVWPALWPALVVAVALASTRHIIPLRLLAVLVHMGVGIVMYAALFFAFGLDREERQWCTQKLTDVWKRRSQVLAAA